MLNGTLKWFTWVLQSGLKGVFTGMLQGMYIDVTGIWLDITGFLQRYYMHVTWVFHEIYRGYSDVTGMLQGSSSHLKLCISH